MSDYEADINTYNSYVRRFNKHLNHISNKDFNSTISKFETRKTSLERINTHSPLKSNYNNNQIINNIVSVNDDIYKDIKSSKSLLAKLPIISKYILSLSSVESKSNFSVKLSQDLNNLIPKEKNKEIYLNTINHINLNNRNFNINTYSLKNYPIFENKNSIENNTIDCGNNYKNNFINKINTNYLLTCDTKFQFNNKNLLKTNTKFYNMKKEPKFANMKDYITIPDFIGEEPLTEIEFKPIFRDDFFKPSEEKQYEINLYLNTNKMLNNLIYLKIPLDKNGYINTENIVNIKKINKENKPNSDFEEEKIRSMPLIQLPNPSDPLPPPPIIENPNKQFSISEYPGNYKAKNKIDKISKINTIDNEKNLIKDNVNNMKSSVNFGSLTDNDFAENSNKCLLKPKNKPLDINNYSNFNILETNNNLIQEKSKCNILKNDDNLTISENDSDESSILVKTIYNNNIKPYYKLKNEKDKTLIFESRFESGNLLCAFKTEEENNYQLYLQNDTNTNGYIQWFFFRVSNTKKGNKVNFNIINMVRKKCIYKRGLKIMTYSKLEATNDNIGWHRDCDNIFYYTNNLYTVDENTGKKRNLHSLSFDYEFKYDNDTVYFANCIPYFYTKLSKELNLFTSKYSNLSKKSIITKTLGGNNLEMLTITNFTPLKNETSLPQLYSNNNTNLNNSKIFENKKLVILIARQHPGETVGSFVIKGCIDFLLSDSEEAKKLRELYIFKIIPMMNPDGVLVGNSRTSFAGCDLNRRWNKPNEIIHPEIYCTKNMILSSCIKNNISYIIDFHGHFGNYNSFFYCNHKDNKKTCSLFPYLCSKMSKIISFQQSTFKMPKYKNSTERLSLFRELDKNDNNNNIVALETSFFGIKQFGNNKNFYFNSNLLKEIGRDVCLGMLSYYIKQENIKIENLNFTSEEKIKKLDVDMLEFESDLIKEINENKDEDDEEDDESESEPSIDNFDKNKIMKLMPIPNKKKKKKSKNYINAKIKQLSKKGFIHERGILNKNKSKEKNIREEDIKLFNPIKEQKKKIEEDRKKNIAKKNSAKNINTTNININTNNDNLQNNKNKYLLLENTTPNTETNLINVFTQTEDIFFKMHWTYFVGRYKILTGKKFIHHNSSKSGLPNISGMSLLMKSENNNYLLNSISSKIKNDLANRWVIHKRTRHISNWIRVANNNEINDENLLKIYDKPNNNIFQNTQNFSKFSNRENNKNFNLNNNTLYKLNSKEKQQIYKSNYSMRMNKNN